MTNTTEQLEAIERLYERKPKEGDNFILSTLSRGYNSSAIEFSAIMVYSDELEFFADMQPTDEDLGIAIYRFKRPRIFDERGQQLYLEISESSEHEIYLIDEPTIKSWVKNNSVTLSRVLKLSALGF